MEVKLAESLLIHYQDMNNQRSVCHFEPLILLSAYHVKRAIRRTKRESAMNASRCT